MRGRTKLGQQGCNGPSWHILQEDVQGLICLLGALQENLLHLAIDSHNLRIEVCKLGNHSAASESSES